MPSNTYDIIIRGATVANLSGICVADVAVTDGVIREVAISVSGRGTVEIDGAGKVLAPGGIDPHTHFATSSPDGSMMSADDYATGSRAAAAGGVTTVINYAFQQQGESLADTLAKEHAKADGNCIVDYAFHPVLTDLRDGRSLIELPNLVASGYCSIKIFTAYEPFRLTDRETIRVLAECGRLGVVVNVHAEDDGLTDYLTTVLDEQTATPDLMLDGLQRSRPTVAEALAVERATAYAVATNCDVYFVHVSSRAALDVIQRARAAGGRVFSEVRPAYLMLDNRRYDDAGGNAFVCLPPLRTADDRSALWDGLTRGDIDTVASDHTPYQLAQKLGPYRSFTKIPPGFGGVQETCGLLYSYGVATARITLEQFVGLTSASAAKIFGLWPRKGLIAPGSDADLVLIDPTANVTIGPDLMKSASDYSPFFGIDAAAWPIATIAAGKLIYQSGQVTALPGQGSFLPRALNVDGIALQGKEEADGKS